jgi:hypothetical protein
VINSSRLDELELILPLVKHSADCPYWWTENGVFCRISKKVQQLTFRPIMPVARGVDQDGELYLEILWEDPFGNEQRRWLKDSVARDPAELRNLPGSPADAEKARAVARWIGFASGHIDAKASPVVNLCTRMGWIGMEYIWPGHLCGREWIGLPMEKPGRLSATTKAVRTLATLEDQRGYLALVALGLSAAAPLVRFGCSRNPILGMAQTSSRGKSTALRFALSLWGTPERWSLQANSSPKGIEDKGITFPDSPILVEDLHVKAAQNPDIASNILYFLGNGQRRTVASKDLEDTLGGQSRYGVSFYASESEILSGALGGVQFRTWELDGDPMPDWATADQVASATRDGAGAAGPELARWYSDRVDALPQLLSEEYSRGGLELSTATLNAGDIKAVRALAWGLRALRDVLQVPEIREVEICQWLVQRISTNRATVTDSVAAAWDALLTAVVGAQWGREVNQDGRLTVVRPEFLYHLNETVAERVTGFDASVGAGATWDGLYINTNSSFAARHRPKGTAERTLVKAWAERGYIVRPDPAHLKHYRRSGPEGAPVRVWVMVAPEQLRRWTSPDPSDIEAMASQGVSSPSYPSPAPLQEPQPPPDPQEDFFR